ncbi:class I adenylate-forming enzyme family protein [Sphingosinicella sp.]|uniref:class I adenylate-forming enzyme family protein n=1 Tax=Sphingosinicella sp. TaxID=1917971 RepID=UPI0035B4109B
MNGVEELLAREHGTLSALIAHHASARPDKTALCQGGEQLSYAALDQAMDRFASGLRQEGIGPESAIGIVGVPTIAYAVVFLGALRAGCVPAPIAPSGTPEQICAMLRDCAAPVVFVDGESVSALRDFGGRVVELDALEVWMPGRAAPLGVAHPQAEAPFNIIYSSGTTGLPKGIVQSHAMRWQHFQRMADLEYGEAVTLIATPLYSNTTLVSFLPTLAWGGTVVLMRKFDARAYLATAQSVGATHGMLVPVQYQRIMALEDFDQFDLSSFRHKFCTSAPFHAELKRDVLTRWPGRLVEFYGMTEGGGTCILDATGNPDKLHTVGRPAPGSDIRLIDAEGREVGPGEAGEVVGRSGAMMNGYHGRPEATRDAEWFDEAGRRFIRHGDIGRFDADGFLILLGRTKDLIISGGFNIYPSDIEAVVREHPDVTECGVVGVESERWGETPVAFVEARPGSDADAISDWANARLGKLQRISDLVIVDRLPRSAIGKLLKRELADVYARRAP